MKKYQILIIAIAMIFSFTACEEIIILDLENADPKIVIEATVSATDQVASVFLTKSNGFYEDINLNTVTDATVNLTLANGMVINLPMVQNGFYAAFGLNITEGDALAMTVIDNAGNEYSATTTVPHSVSIDSLEIVETNNAGPGGGGIGGGGNVQYYQIFTHWEDIANKPSFYRIKVAVNDTLQAGIYTLSDDINRNGDALSQPVFQTFEAGDTITVELQSIDKDSYLYFSDLSAIQGQGFSSSTPFNPTSNFSNNALGYFGIVQISKQTVILP